jgi:hypothetical protein
MTDFACKVDEGYRSACEELSAYKDTGYCTLHFPTYRKDETEFKSVVESKLSSHDFNFRGVWFPSAWKQFSHHKFEGNADFSGAIFQYADFEGVIFDGDVNFTKTVFCATFEDEERTDFRRATFSGQAYFKEARFTGYTDFYRARFLGAASFVGVADASREESKYLFHPSGRVSFNRTLIERPEQFLFDTVTLRISWFVGVDPRNFRFNDVRWYGLPGGPKCDIEEEIRRLVIPTWARHEEQEGWKLTETTCRELHINTDENRDYPLANEFHYWTMEAQRKAMPRSNFAPWRLIWWYWALSGYGERQMRAGMWLLGTLFGFAALYLWVGPMRIETPSLVGVLQAAPEALVYSLGVMTRLANDIPKSASPLVTSLIVIEGVLGPLLIGLLLLALRREFMR